MTEVILVDKNDKQIGRKEKMQAHKDADLHRAFSVFLFDNKGRLLIHQRAFDKYHSGGLWTNTCCSHPLPDENIINAGKRRLIEELGIEVKELNDKGSILYKFPLDNELTEHELDHILIGKYHSQKYTPNPDEIADTRFISKVDLVEEINQSHDKFTQWFKLILKEKNPFDLFCH